MSFESLATHPLPGRGGTVSLFSHGSGLRHAHLSDPTVPATFFMAFPTLHPGDKGIAHVLEHLVLSGSERYPVRELFTRLGERTLASYLNAFTTDSFTAYPFVSPHAADFLSVLPVYLDAVFRPLLREVDFRQEGVRVELDEQGQASFQGVVFNEMKGVFDDPFHHAHHGLLRTLYPTSALGCESGGDPLAIPQLTIEAVRAFHADHYHPAHAWVFTAGDPALVPAIQSALLPYLTTGDAPPAPPVLPASPLQGVTQALQTVPSEDLGWVWACRVGHGLGAVELQTWDLLSSALLTQDSSPWQIALQHSGYGRPGPLTGSLRVGQDHWLLVQVEGLNDAEEQQASQALLREVLAQAATAPEALPLTVAYRQLEGRQRMALDTGASGAVNRFSQACEAALYGQDSPADLALALDPLASLEEVRRQLTPLALGERLSPLAHADQVWLTLQPDPTFQAQRRQQETLQAHAWTARATDPQVRAVLEQAQAHDAAWMAQPDAGEGVPATPLDLVPLATSPTPSLTQPEAGWGHIDVPLVGVGALLLVAEVDHLSDPEALDAKLLWEELLLQLGMGDLPWETAMAQREAVTTTLTTGLESVVDQHGHTRLALVIQARGLTSDTAAIAAVIEQTVRFPRLDEAERLAYLLSTLDDDLHDTRAAHADMWVHHRLQAQLTRQGAWLEQSEGLPGLAQVHRWREAADQDPEGTAARLAHVYAHLLGTLSWTAIGVGGPEWGEAAEQMRHRLVAEGLRVSRLPGGHPGRPPMHPQPEQVGLVVREAQSRHLSVGWPVPGEDHADGPRLTLLGKVLDRPLFEAIRSVGGAYGAWARYDHRSFTLTTYRDPRLEGSLRDLEVVRQQAATVVDEATLSDARRAVFQKLDRPTTAWDLAQRAFRMTWQGRTDTQRQAFRQGLRQASAQDLADAARRWLGEPAGHVVAYLPERETAQAQAWGLALERVTS